MFEIGMHHDKTEDGPSGLNLACRKGLSKISRYRKELQIAWFMRNPHNHSLGPVAGRVIRGITNMLAYKFRSSTQIAFALDIVFKQRLYCSDWSTLNDPMEGRFLHSPISPEHAEYAERLRQITDGKKIYKICSLSKTYGSRLLWAHYASGFDGLAVEVELPTHQHISKIHDVIIAASSGPGPFSTAELALLEEKTFHLAENGKPSVKAQFPKTKDNLLFTKSCLEKAFGYSLDLNNTPNNWKDFKEAIVIRNRITHPKGLLDFEVSKEESELARRVGHWFDDFVVDWFKQFVTTHPVDKGEETRDKSKRDDYTM